jgi:tetratricopeptide (TPR) repeat protein
LRPNCKVIHKLFSYPQVASIAALLMFICLLGLAPSTAAQVSGHMGKVLIRVRNRVNEEWLAQVQIQLIRFPAEVVDEQFTGSDGSVQFSGLSVGAFTARASLQGYESGDAHIDLRDGDSNVQNVEISLMPRKQETNGIRGTISANALNVPDNARREFERGSRLLNEKKDFGRSIAAFRRAVEQYPGYAQAYFLMGTALMQINDASAAEASLRKAIELDPHMTAPYYALAVLMFGQLRYAEEKELLLKAQDLDAFDWRWPFELARCDAQQGQWESALRYGLAAGGSANAPPKVHLLLADIYANSNKPREAVAELELFAKLDPKSSYMGRVREVLPVLRQRSEASTLPSPEPR